MTDLERIKKDVVEMDSRANVCWYDTKVLTKAVRLILEELTADHKTEPTISKMEQVDKDINVRSKTEPQMVTEAERQYRLLKEVANEAWNKYEANKVEDEPQTDNGIGCSRCEGGFDCYDRDMPHAVHCNNYGKVTDELQTERSSE